MPRDTPPFLCVNTGVAPRGVYKACWRGVDGEIVLVAIASDHRKVCELTVPHGADRLEYADRAWQMLEAVDPEPATLRIG